MPSKALCLLPAAVCLAQPAQAPAPEKLYAEGVRLHQSGDLTGAIEKYRAALKLRPDFVAARSNLGAVLAKLGRYDEAIEAYEQALKGGADHPGIRLNLGLAYYKRGQVKQAAEQISRALDKLPNNFQATLLLADCYLQQGLFPKVIALLEPVV
jgi:tetratricopeptide (TPR) repeat protein